MVLEDAGAAIVLAPLGGGPSTPELAVAVSEAGGLGFLASGYLSAAATAERIAATRRLTGRPFGVNAFVPGPRSPVDLAPFVARLGPDAGEPKWDDDDWDAKLELLRDDPPAVVSFTFGCPAREAIASLSSEVWVTVTSVDEAREAVAAGADALVVQGGEAGGHRASFVDRPDLPVYALLPLLQMVRAAVDVPLVATGGIATAAAVEAVLALGASAAQVGTSFMLCPEAGTSDVHRRAIASSAPTALTRAFTGRLARGIRNRFMDEHADAPIAYPELHNVTAPIRAAAREHGDHDLVNLWAGEAHELARERPAADVVRAMIPV